MYTRCMNNLPFYEKNIRPWGNFERFTLNEQSTVKIIAVNKGEELSLQKHSKRSEFWKIISGSGSVIIGKEHKNAIPGDTFFISMHTHHRIEAGDTTLTFLEIGFGDFDENDIERLEDKYGRV